jgi:pimeloyl-ACP methyl ester carboxylesterase
MPALFRGQTASAQAWFAGGERVGYDPKARAIVPARDAPLKIFLSREGDLAQAVCFLPGFPDGAFGCAKVRWHLPNAVEMPKLFVDYVGMGDSDKPRDYAYSAAERTDLLEAIWRDLAVQSTTLVGFDFSSLVILEHACDGPSVARGAPGPVNALVLSTRGDNLAMQYRRGDGLRRFLRHLNNDRFTVSPMTMTAVLRHTR